MDIGQAKEKLKKYLGDDQILGVSKMFNAYVVGGAIRDILLCDKFPNLNDIDLTTPLTPEEIIEVANKNGIKHLPTGIKHGTISILWGEKNWGNGTWYEITTFRLDKDCDGRHASVEFSKDIKEDLARRDFSINAMAYCPATEDFVCAENALEDLGRGIIRAVGKPKERFHEDYLRMLRAVRFSGQLEFSIEEKTFSAIQELAPFLQRISKERIKEELSKGLSGDVAGVQIFLDTLIKSGLMKFVLPEVEYGWRISQNKYHNENLLEHSLLAAANIKKDDWLLRFCALIHDCGKIKSEQIKVVKSISCVTGINLTPNGFQVGGYADTEVTFIGHDRQGKIMAGKICDDLKFSCAEKEFVCKLVRNHMFSLADKITDRSIKKLVGHIGEQSLLPLLRLRMADSKANLKKNEEDIKRVFAGAKRFLRQWDKIKREQHALKISDLAVSGEDVMEILKIKPGPEVGKVLRRLFDLVLEQPELNEREKLLKMIGEGK